MADDHTRAELAQLRALVETLQVDQAALRAERYHPRRRPPRRFLPLVLVALLVALVPLASLAAGPTFNDLNAGSVHNANIQAIADAGITKGCDPGVSYCPNGLVTREEMASFLARTAGLGTNPPVANARTAQTAQTALSAQTADTATNATTAQNAVTAQTATNATTAQNAVTAQTAANATSATNATNATNADKLDGYDASALNRIAFSGTRLVDSVAVFNFTTVGRVTITIPGPAPQAVHVRGALNLYSQPNGGRVLARLLESGGASSVSGYFPYLTDSTGTGIMAYSGYVFTAAPGTHTYQFRISHNAPGALFIEAFTLTATTHPFGNSGAAGATEIEPAPPAPVR